MNVYDIVQGVFCNIAIEVLSKKSDRSFVIERRVSGDVGGYDDIG